MYPAAATPAAPGQSPTAAPHFRRAPAAAAQRDAAPPAWCGTPTTQRPTRGLRKISIASWHLLRAHSDLTAVHSAVDPFGLQQSARRAVLDDAASIEHHDSIECIERRETMSDGEYGAALEQ